MTDTPASPASSSTVADTSPLTANENSTEANATEQITETVEPWRKVKHRMKSLGEVEEIDYDELVKRAEKAMGSEKRLAEAARKEKEIQGKIDKMKTVEDLNEIVDLMGGEARARPLLEKFLWDKIQAEESEAKLSPTEREAKKRADEAEKKAKDAQDRLDALDKAAKEENTAASRNKANAIINNEINEAISLAEKEGLSPEDVPYMVEQLIENMLVHLEYLEDCEAADLAPTKSPLSPRDVLRKIQDKHSDRSRSWLKKLSAKDLQALLSSEQLDGLRRSEIEALTQPSTQNRATSKQNKKSDAPVDPFTQPKETRKKPNTKDWFSAMDQRYRNTNGR